MFTSGGKIADQILRLWGGFCSKKSWSAKNILASSARNATVDGSLKHGSWIRYTTMTALGDLVLTSLQIDENMKY